MVFENRKKLLNIGRFVFTVESDFYILRSCWPLFPETITTVDIKIAYYVFLTVYYQKII